MRSVDSSKAGFSSSGDCPIARLIQFMELALGDMRTRINMETTHMETWREMCVRWELPFVLNIRIKWPARDSQSLHEERAN